MLNSKDMAQRAVAGCSHSVPVMIPCSSCVEQKMVAWALTVREDFRNSLRSEWDSINADRDASKKEIEKLLKRLESKESELNRLQIQLGSLGSQLIVAKAEAEEARVQLHAEQAVKNTVKRATA